jgi:hypothetical protein
MYKSTKGRYVDTSIWVPHPVVGLIGKLSHQNTHNSNEQSVYKMQRKGQNLPSNNSRNRQSLTDQHDPEIPL